jgi:hypothetical protein
MTNRVTLTPVNLAGPSGLLLPTVAGAQTLATFTGVQFVNNGSVFLVAYIGAAGAGNVQSNIGRRVQGQAYPAATLQAAVANSSLYFFGPWSAADFTQSDGSGMAYIDFSVVTGNSVTLYQCVPIP